MFIVTVTVCISLPLLSITISVITAFSSFIGMSFQYDCENWSLFHTCRGNGSNFQSCLHFLLSMLYDPSVNCMESKEVFPVVLPWTGMKAILTRANFLSMASSKVMVNGRRVIYGWARCWHQRRHYIGKHLAQPYMDKGSRDLMIPLLLDRWSDYKLMKQNETKSELIWIWREFPQLGCSGSY